MDSLEKALFCAETANENKAVDLVILELKDQTALSDYFIICSGTSDRHAKSIAEDIELKLKEKGIKPLGKEGLQESKWILLDYDDVIIHIFQAEEREFYDLESLWDECPKIPCGQNIK